MGAACASCSPAPRTPIEHSPLSEVRANVEALPYVGPTTAELFLRDLKELYPQVKDVLDVSDRALEAAQHLGFVSKSVRPSKLQKGANSDAHKTESPVKATDALEELAKAAGVDSRDLETALIKLHNAHYRGYVKCPGGIECVAARAGGEKEEKGEEGAPEKSADVSMEEAADVSKEKPSEAAEGTEAAPAVEAEKAPADVSEEKAAEADEDVPAAEGAQPTLAPAEAALSVLFSMPQATLEPASFEAEPDCDSDLTAGSRIIVYYPAEDDVNTLQKRVTLELATCLPDTSLYEVEFADAASVVLYLGIVKATRGCKLGALLDALSQASAKGPSRFTLILRRDPAAECEELVFEPKREASGAWVFSRVPRSPKIDRVLYVSIEKVQIEAGRRDEYIVVHGTDLHSQAQDFTLKWRTRGPKHGRLLPSNPVHPDEFRLLNLQMLIEEPDSVGMDLPDLGERAAGRLYLECWANGVTAVGNRVPVNLSIFQTARDAAAEKEPSRAEDVTIFSSGGGEEAVGLSPSPAPELDGPSSESGTRFRGEAHSTAATIQHEGPLPQDAFLGDEAVQRWRDGRWKYDVFISHAGEDKAFAHALRNAFQFVGLKAFVDEADLPGGAPADVRMLTAVREAPVGLALFSKRFFGKVWPIKELKRIVKEATLLPVLYNTTYEEAEEALLRSPHVDAASSQTDGFRLDQYVNTVLRTTALKNPSTGYDERPFLEYVVFSAVGLCVKSAGPKLAEHSSNQVFAYAFVNKLDAAAAAISQQFRRLTVEQVDEARDWCVKMRQLAARLMGDGA